MKLQDIQLEVPATWKQQQPTSRLRAGQFQLPAVGKDKDSAELVVYFFGGAGGGVVGKELYVAIDEFINKPPMPTFEPVR